VYKKQGGPGLLIGALALLVLQLFSLMAGNELNVAGATKMIDKFEDSLYSNVASGVTDLAEKFGGDEAGCRVDVRAVLFKGCRRPAQ
jgi:hypothetical protein